MGLFELQCTRVMPDRNSGCSSSLETLSALSLAEKSEVLVAIHTPAFAATQHFLLNYVSIFF
jgi:hypothetical protein